MTTREKFSFIALRRHDTAQASGLRDNHAMSDKSPLGAEFAQALAEKDAERLRSLLSSQIDFRAMTPRKTWEAQDPDGGLEIVFGNWFEDGDEIEALEQVETDAFADRERVGYRLNVTNAEGRFLVEQQAYFAEGEDDGRIAWMRVMCAGYRPVADES